MIRGNSKKSKIFNDRFHQMKRLHNGKDSIIYEVVDSKDGEPKALKMFNSKTAYVNEVGAMQKLKGIDGSPQMVKKFGDEDGKFGVVSEVLFENLESVKEERGGGFTLETVLCVAWYLFAIFKKVHERGVLHMNITPRNVMIRKGDKLYPPQPPVGKKKIGKGKKKDKKKNKKKGPAVSPFVVIDWKSHGRSTRGDGKPLMDPDCNPTTPSIHEGNKPSKKDDQMMIVYILLFLLDLNVFDGNYVEMNMKQKKEFEDNPKDFISEDWLVKIVERIVKCGSKPSTAYSGIMTVLRHAKPKFKPAEHVFLLSSKGWNPYLI